jgi:hypothetical protein
MAKSHVFLKFSMLLSVSNESSTKSAAMTSRYPDPVRSSSTGLLEVPVASSAVTAEHLQAQSVFRILRLGLGS